MNTSLGGEISQERLGERGGLAREKGSLVEDGVITALWRVKKGGYSVYHCCG